MSDDKQSTKPKQDTPLDGSDQVAVRQAKLDLMRENGFDPFSSNWEQSHTSLQAQGLLPEEDEEGPEVSVAGRIVAFRLMGKASFLKILNQRTGQFHHPAIIGICLVCLKHSKFRIMPP